MLIGINTGLWQYPFNWEKVDLLKKIEGFGFDAVEMIIEDRSKKNIEIIRENLKKTGLKRIICSAFLDGNLISEDKEVVRRGIKYVKESIDLCEYLGADILVGPTYGSCIIEEHIDIKKKNRSRQQCIEALKNIGKYALDKNKKIAIEPINRYESSFINTAKEGIDLVLKVNLGNVGLHLDTFHMNIEEKDSKKAVLDAGKYLFHLHAPENDYGTPGTGSVDWSGISDSLKKIDFNGFVVMECGTLKVKEIAKLGAFWRVFDYSQDKMAIEGLKFLKKILG